MKNAILRTNIPIFILIILSLSFIGNSMLQCGNIYAATRQSSYGEYGICTLSGRDVLNPAKKQKAVIRHKKGTELFKRHFFYGKWKKALGSSEKIEPGSWSLIALLSGVGFILLGYIPSLAFLFVIGLLLIITALVLGKYAKNNSTGKDKKIGEIAMKVAKAILITIVIMTVITIITVLIWLAAIF